MDLDSVLKLTQIAFYAIAGAITILTYIKAKNGLLNAVNTEYKKRVMDRLAEISRELVSEYDWYSPSHWSKVDPVMEVLDHLHGECLPHKEEILRTKQIQMPPGIPVSEFEQKLYRMAEIVKSDPFIPRAIRSQLLDFYEGRAAVMTRVFIEEIGAYRKALENGKHWDTLDANHGWVHNRILERLREQGCGIEQIEEEVHALRDAIQDYFEAFDPISRSRA
jgi:hypothetical protein